MAFATTTKARAFQSISLLLIVLFMKSSFARPKLATQTEVGARKFLTILSSKILSEDEIKNMSSVSSTKNDGVLTGVAMEAMSTAQQKSVTPKNKMSHSLISKASGTTQAPTHDHQAENSSETRGCTRNTDPTPKLGTAEYFKSVCQLDAKLSIPHLITNGSRLEWIGSENAAFCMWLIDVTASGLGGLVLQFDKVALQRGRKAAEDDTVTVYKCLQDQVSKKLAHVQGSLPVSPILVPSERVLIHLVAHGRQKMVENNAWNDSHEHQSRFSLSYSAHSVQLLPPQVSSETIGRYNCSPPYDVPRAIRCDKVEQCAQGEDEKNCSYKDTQCREGWIPVESENICLKFVFPRLQVSPQEAKNECEYEQGQLASLYTPKITQFVVKLVSLSGYKEVVVGLVKIENYVKDLLDRFPVLRSEILISALRIYRFLWFWPRGKILELNGPLLHAQGTQLNCTTLQLRPGVYLKPVRCSEKLEGYVCMTEKRSVSRAINDPVRTLRLHLKPPSNTAQAFPGIKCTDGSFVKDFTECPRYIEANETRQGIAQTRRYSCTSEASVAYSAVCNGFGDCLNESDENNCINFHRRFPKTSSRIFLCSDGKSVFLLEQRCNGQSDCWDGSDEQNCRECAEGLVLNPQYGCIPRKYEDYNSAATTGNVTSISDDVLRGLIADDFKMKTTLRVLELDGYGFGTVKSTSAQHCPETHFRCQDGLCIPSYMLGSIIVSSCLHSIGAGTFKTILVCPGYYRCYGFNQMCIHPDYMCDGVNHCPIKDDEIYCNVTCPSRCTCTGLEFKCDKMFEVTDKHRFLRYLDLSNALRPPLDDILQMHYLSFLNLSSCGFRYINFTKKQTFEYWKLIVLDLSFNGLKAIPYALMSPSALLHLNLSGNPFVATLLVDSFKRGDFYFQKTLWSLSLSDMNFLSIPQGTFAYFRILTFLDLSGNAIENFTSDMFDGLATLRTLILDDHRLCCVYRSQHSNPMTCEAPVDELSSCSDLLSSGFLRVILWLQSLMAVVGNVGVFVFRVCLDTEKTSTGYRVLIINLCTADLLMGIYMTIIGAADAHYLGRYLWEQDLWTESSLCKAAGLMALLSSEVSVFIICLVTVDRFLVLRFPFQHRLHLTSRSAMVLCGFVWTVGAMLAVVPLLPITKHWEFYSQTGICLPLPITRKQFPGQTYSFSVFIVLNFILFLFIGAGQLSIYRAIRNTPMVGRTQRRRQDMAIARRLFLIAFTDFCCWFPVGLMGLLAARGTPIPGELNVWTAVLVLPINSALNPFLYTLNVLLEKRQKGREERKMQNILGRIHVEINTWPEEKVIQMSRCCELAMKRFESAETELSHAGNGQQGRNTTEPSTRLRVEPTCCPDGAALPPRVSSSLN